MCRLVDVYGFTTEESEAATRGSKYHYYDQAELRQTTDDLQESGRLISELARREPRLRLHRPSSTLSPELHACGGASA